jgi:hypothetical protein
VGNPATPRLNPAEAAAESVFVWGISGSDLPTNNDDRWADILVKNVGGCFEQQVPIGRSSPGHASQDLTRIKAWGLFLQKQNQDKDPLARWVHCKNQPFVSLVTPTLRSGAALFESLLLEAAKL